MIRVSIPFRLYVTKLVQHFGKLAQFFFFFWGFEKDAFNCLFSQFQPRVMSLAQRCPNFAKIGRIDPISKTLKRTLITRVLQKVLIHLCIWQCGTLFIELFCMLIFFCGDLSLLFFNSWTYCLHSKLGPRKNSLYYGMKTFRSRCDRMTPCVRSWNSTWISTLQYFPLNIIYLLGNG